MISIAEIKQFFKGKILFNEPMAHHTTIKIGGNADLFVFPSDKDDAVELLKYLQQNKLSYIVIGNGSNILVNDSGINGIVISFSKGLNKLKFRDGFIEVEAGIQISRFVDFCIQNDKQGVEKLAGIPGTIGGAIIMNAGAYNCEISDYILDIDIIREGELIRVKKNEANFGYRTSGLSNSIVLSARFDLPNGIRYEAMKVRSEYLQKRNQTQPLNYPNCGSVFKNPPSMYAAKLIEESNLKGLRIGDAQISEKHANFIVNLGNAKAVEVLKLIDICKETVEKKFGIILQLEIKLLGFEK